LSLKIVSWNLDGKIELWYVLADMDADIALLQEAGEPPSDLDNRVCVDPAPWSTDGWPGWSRRMAIAILSDRVEVKWITAKSFAEAGSGEFAVSRMGTLTAAHVSSSQSEPLVVASMYSMWENPHTSTGSSWIVSDASAHRLVSDLSAFIGTQGGHRIVAAGDLNILHGYGEYGNEYWEGRYGSVFDRMEALGLPFVGPQHPQGRQADPWPDELPGGSKNVPTYHTNRQTPLTATRQLDFVFASKGMADSVSVRALNEPDEWGPSDHCKIEITVS
jgi:hypothetical protein